MNDPYTVLGLKPDAAAADIQRAYRKLAKRWHPDVNAQNPKAEDRFKEITAANAFLSDPEKRGAFDRGEIDADGHPTYVAPPHYETRGRADPRQGSGWDDSQFNDAFDSLFSRRPGGHPRAARPRRGADDQFTLETSFLDAVNGATQRLTLPNGRTLDVKIPPGTEEGQVLSLKGRGGEGLNGGEAGDALIAISIARHPLFVREGSTLRLVQQVGIKQAVLGGQVTTPTPSGPVQLRIPRHSDAGTELRLRGKGVPAHNGKPAGDLIVTLAIVIGPPDAAFEAFLEGWDSPHAEDELKQDAAT